MVSKLILVLLLTLSVLGQITPINTQALNLIPGIIGPSNPTFNPTPISNPSSNPTSSSGNQIDIDESQASSLIGSLFSSNPSAARTLIASSTPAPTNAPAGAMLSQTAPSTAMRASVAGSSSSYFGGGYWGWGHWVRVLRCTWNYWGNGFCCNWVWVWRYWWWFLFMDVKLRVLCKNGQFAPHWYSSVGGLIAMAHKYKSDLWWYNPSEHSFLYGGRGCSSSLRSLL